MRKDKLAVYKAIVGKGPQMKIDGPAEDILTETWITRTYDPTRMCEVVDVETRRRTDQPNRDIPEIQAFMDMGLSQQTRETFTQYEIGQNQFGCVHVDEPVRSTVTPMNRAHFQECTQVVGNRLYAIHMKVAVDMQRPFFKRPEWIVGFFGGNRGSMDSNDAMDIAEAMDRLEFDKKTALEILREAKRVNTTMQQVAENLTSMANELPELSKEAFEVYIEDSGDDIDKDDIDEMDQFDDSLSVSDSVFTAHPMYSGDEALSFEYTQHIKSMNLAQLKELSMKLMGKGSPLKYATPAQKSMAWAYIKNRKREILKKILSSVSAQVKRTLTAIRNNEFGADTWKLVSAQKRGGKGTIGRKTYTFTAATTAEAALIDEVFKARQKKTRKTELKKSFKNKDTVGLKTLLADVSIIPQDVPWKIESVKSVDERRAWVDIITHQALIAHVDEKDIIRQAVQNGLMVHVVK